jgi:hypothetical protein
MHHPTAILGRWRQQRRPLGAVALTMVLMLLAGPVRLAMGGCDLCPPDCPMHATHGEPGREAPRMKCHNAPAQAGADGGIPRLSRPPCGTHAAIHGLDVTPMLPASPLRWRATSPINTAPAHHARAGGRAADPPDTPPPDARA